MGIDIGNSLLVGASYEELEEFFERKLEEHEEQGWELYEVIEAYLDSASPYYDSDPTDRFYGLSVPNYVNPDDAWFSTVKSACERFQALTGVKARLRGGADVW